MPNPMFLIAQRDVLQLAVVGVLGAVATSTLPNDESSSDDGYDSGYASSSSSSDDDAFYDNVEVWISCAWASATSEHLNSENCLTVPFIARQRTDWDAAVFRRRFRFEQEDFGELMAALQIPPIFQTKCRFRVDGETALLIYLQKMASAHCTYNQNLS